MISSRLDYCNSLLLGAPDSLLRQLQLVQNTAARVVTRSRKSCSATALLKRLHWLPVEYRIVFKTLLLTFKALNGLAPEYICELLKHYSPARTLRSSQSVILLVPMTATKCGEKCFSVQAPRLWNSLPDAIKSCDTIEHFKSSLKTHLFRIAFRC